MDYFWGIVYLPAVTSRFEKFVDEGISFEALALSPMTLAATMSVSAAIDRFQYEYRELVFVVDESETVAVVYHH